MLRCVAEESWPIDLKSFSPDQPWGSTGRGNEKWTAAIFVAMHNSFFKVYCWMLMVFFFCTTVSAAIIEKTRQEIRKLCAVVLRAQAIIRKSWRVILAKRPKVKSGSNPQRLLIHSTQAPHCLHWLHHTS